MSASVDTNVLIRHLTGDPPETAARATRYLAAADELLLADLIVAETVLLRALEVCEVHRLDFAEAYLVAAAEVTGVGVVASSDDAVGRVGSVRHVVPGA